MFEDIIICELNHSDPHNYEFCLPREIVVGRSRNDGILFSFLFRDFKERNKLLQSKDSSLNISCEVINKNAIDFKDKYDIQTGAILKISAINQKLQNTIESYSLLIGSNGNNFFYFTTSPSINNTTDFGDIVFINFNHCVESFSFDDISEKRKFI